MPRPREAGCSNRGRTAHRARRREPLLCRDAARGRDRAALADLLKQKADVNAPQGDGATALTWAAHWNELETADQLIRAGANANAANELGVTPLMLAALNGSGPMVEKLLAA